MLSPLPLAGVGSGVGGRDGAGRRYSFEINSGTAVNRSATRP